MIPVRTHSSQLVLGVGACLSLLFLDAATSLGVPILGYGQRTQQAAGAGQTQSRGAPAILHNPANLVMSRHEVYYEINYLNLLHRYTPAEEKYPIAEIKVGAPPVAVGGAYHKRKKPWAAGIMMIPLGTGDETKIEKVPLQTGTTVSIFDEVSRGQAGYQLGFGYARRFKKRYTFGLALNMLTESYTVKAVNDTVTLMDADYSGTFWQYKLGTRIAVSRRLKLGVSYTSAIKKEYSGSVIISGVETNSPPKEYIPSSLGFGVQYRLNQISYFFDTLYEFHEDAKTYVQGPFPGGPEETDLKNAYLLSVGGRYYSMMRHQSFVGAFGMATGNKGDGLIVENADGFPEVIVTGGGQFGDMEAIPHKIYTFGWTYSKRSYEINAMFKYLTGQRIVADGLVGEGFYQVKTTTLGVGGLVRL